MKSLAVLLMLAPFPALAHVHVAPETVVAGQPVELALQVGHGCAGAATTQIRVALPAGLTGVTVAAKPGWQAALVTDAASGRVKEVVWSGGALPDKVKERFAFTATAAGAGALPLPVIQNCGAAELRWIETGAGAEHPAPVLTVAPGA